MPRPPVHGPPRLGRGARDLHVLPTRVSLPATDRAPRAHQYTNPHHWNAVADEWTVPQPRLWRAHSDAVNSLLLARWLPEKRVARLLKTDLFDEAVSAGLFHSLDRAARQVVGIDVSQPINAAAAAQYPSLDTVLSDVRALAFADGTFDVVASISTLDHFRSDAEVEHALREIARVMRPGGTLVITVDNLGNPLVALRNRLPFRVVHWLGLVPYFVGRTYTVCDLEAILRSVAFDVEDRCALVHAPRVLAAAAARAIDRSGSERLRAAFLRGLMAWERLDLLPTRFATGHFVAVRAVKRPALGVARQAGGRRVSSPEAGFGPTQVRPAARLRFDDRPTHGALALAGRWAARALSVFRRRMLLISYPTGTSVIPAVRVASRASYRVLEPSELPAYDAFRTGHDPSVARARMARGDRCVVVWRGGRVAACCWSARGEVYVPYLDARLALAPGDVYHYDLFTAYEARGRGLLMGLIGAAAKVEQADGARRSVGLIAVENVTSWTAFRDLGVESVGEYTMLRVGPWRRYGTSKCTEPMPPLLRGRGG